MVDAPVRRVDDEAVSCFYEGDRPALDGFWRDVPNTKAVRAATEPSIRQ